MNRETTKFTFFSRCVSSTRQSALVRSGHVTCVSLCSGYEDGTHQADENLRADGGKAAKI